LSLRPPDAGTIEIFGTLAVGGKMLR